MGEEEKDKISFIDPLVISGLVGALIIDLIFVPLSLLAVFLFILLPPLSLIHAALTFLVGFGIWGELSKESHGLTPKIIFILGAVLPGPFTTLGFVLAIITHSSALARFAVEQGTALAIGAATGGTGAIATKAMQGAATAAKAAQATEKAVEAAGTIKKTVENVRSVTSRASQVIQKAREGLTVDRPPESAPEKEGSQEQTLAEMLGNTYDPDEAIKRQLMPTNIEDLEKEGYGTAKEKEVEVSGNTIKLPR